MAEMNYFDDDELLRIEYAFEVLLKALMDEDLEDVTEEALGKAFDDVDEAMVHIRENLLSKVC